MTDTEVVPVAGEVTDPGIVRAAALLRAGELVAFPTETVYGLGAHALDPAAVAKIFLAKGRPSHNPLIVHVADVESAQALVSDWPVQAEQLAARFWPGPLTLVLPKWDAVPSLVTAGLSTVALRIPRHPVALALLRAAALPIAAPSANRSEAVSPTTAAHVAAGLKGRVSLILDGGPTDVGIESTVVDLSGDTPRILRPGLISAIALQEALGVPVPLDEPARGDAARRSPGQLERHYAPRALVRLYDGDAPPPPAGAGAIVLRPGSSGGAREIALPDDPAGYARGLYAALHTLDAAGVSLILVERPPNAPSWTAIHDRLRRAAHS